MSNRYLIATSENLEMVKKLHCHNFFIARQTSRHNSKYHHFAKSYAVKVIFRSFTKPIGASLKKQHFTIDLHSKPFFEAACADTFLRG
jgi:hypothetical protein